MTCCEVIVTICSTIASGLLSWLVTCIYFHIANRNAALSGVIDEIIDIINCELNNESIESMKAVITKYEFRFLRKKERDIIKRLYTSLKNAQTRSEFEIDIKILTNHFDVILNQRGINKDIQYYHDDTTDTSIFLPPPEIDHLFDEIKEKLKCDFYYYLNLEDDNSKFLEKEINDVYNYYLNEFLHERYIDFFEGISVKTILETDELKIAWKKNWDNYKKYKNEFIEKFDKEYKKQQKVYE